MRYTFLLKSLMILLFCSQTLAGDFFNLAGKNTLEISEIGIWHKVDPQEQFSNFSSIEKSLTHTQPVEGTLVGHSGSYVAKIALINNSDATQTWFVNPNLIFVDIGLAFWQRDDGSVERLDDFSQLNDYRTPVLMHSQAISLITQKQEQGYLWLYVDAKQYVNPLSIKIYNTAAFYQNQFIVNVITITAIAVMLTLALIAVIIFFRTKNSITIACAGYIGLHGLGWASAAGLLDDIFSIGSVNLSYTGILIFPFAIAFASQFTKLLFNCQQEHFLLARYLNILTLACVAVGALLPWVNYSLAFTISHLIALIWITSSVAIGIKMLRRKFSRAKYYLLGNASYGVALLIYVLLHARIIEANVYPELIVLSALAIDCICILLSLAEWLYGQQRNYNRSIYLARIDPLTNTGNRHLMSEKFAGLKSHFIIVFIDFDGIKSINDQFGHEKGDLFLIEGAALMKRKTNDKGDVFRTGGDEFVWLFDVNHKNDLTALVRQTNTLVNECENELRQQGWHSAGISYGIATSLEGNNQSECMSLADKRMYAHKRSKKALLNPHEDKGITSHI